MNEYPLRYFNGGGILTYGKCLFHNTVDVLLHPLGAGLFHLIGHVAVDVQRESCRGMAQVALYCFDVVTGANGSNGVGVS